MPTVPVLNQNQVKQDPMTGAKFQAADFGAGGEMVGKAVQRFGQELAYSADQLDQINAIHDEAAAKRQDNLGVDRIRDLLWTGDNAFYTKEGFDAGNARPDVEKQLDAIRNELAGQLKNDRQREMFGRVFDRRLAQEREGIARYSIGQVSKEEERQSIARGVNAATEAVTYADDPVRSETAIATGISEIRSRASKQGWAPEVAKAEEAKYVSGIRAQQIDAKTRADPVTAMALVEKYRDQLLPEDEQKLRDTLFPAMMERQAVADIDAYAGVVTDVVPSAPKPEPGQAPTMARMQAITAYSESRGREYNPDGSRVTSPKGARGVMQVMPGTARDPGYGIKPSDGSPAEDARVGREKLAAMMRRYGGDPAKAWAAYNWGEGNVDKAIAQRGDAWLSAAPAETKAYVASNTAALGGGQPGVGRYSPRRDDLAGIYGWIDAQPWDFERKQQARAEADRRVARNDMLLRRQEQDAHDTALGLVDRLGDGFKSLTQLPPDLQRRLSPEDRHSFGELAKQNAAPKPRQTDDAFYLRMSDTYALDKRAFLAISPAEARKKLSDSDWDKYVNMRKDALSPGAAKTPQQVAHSRILSVTKDALAGDNNPILFGDNKEAMKPENVRRRAAFTSAMAERVAEWQAVNGRDKVPSDDDLRRMAGNLLLDTNSGVNIFEATDQDIATSISARDRDRITTALRSRNLPVTPANIARFYRQLGAFGHAQPVQ